MSLGRAGRHNVELCENASGRRFFLQGGGELVFPQSSKFCWRTTRSGSQPVADNREMSFPGSSTRDFLVVFSVEGIHTPPWRWTSRWVSLGQGGGGVFHAGFCAITVVWREVTKWRKPGRGRHCYCACRFSSPGGRRVDAYPRVKQTFQTSGGSFRGDLVYRAWRDVSHRKTGGDGNGSGIVAVLCGRRSRVDPAAVATGRLE